MDIEEITIHDLSEYAKVSSQFESNSILEIQLVDNGLGGIQMTEKQVEHFTYHYDSYERPTVYPEEFDMTNWGIFLAKIDQVPVGGVIIAYNTPGVNMLEGKTDLAVLWDLRVSPDHRGEGIGKALFEKTVEWSRERKCKRLKVETQNINIRACRFYESQGCKLGQINLYAYDDEELQNQVMLIWYLDLFA